MSASYETHCFVSWKKIFDHEIILSRGHSINFVNLHHNVTFGYSNHFGIQNIWNVAKSYQNMSDHVKWWHIMVNIIISYHFNVNHFQKNWKNSKTFVINSKRIWIISRKVGKIPNILELDLNQFQKSWKKSKIFGIISKKFG